MKPKHIVTDEQLKQLRRLTAQIEDTEIISLQETSYDALLQEIMKRGDTVDNIYCMITGKQYISDDGLINDKIMLRVREFIKDLP